MMRMIDLSIHIEFRQALEKARRQKNEFILDVALSMYGSGVFLTERRFDLQRMESYIPSSYLDMYSKMDGNSKIEFVVFIMHKRVRFIETKLTSLLFKKRRLFAEMRKIEKFCRKKLNKAIQ